MADKVRALLLAGRLQEAEAEARRQADTESNRAKRVAFMQRCWGWFLGQRSDNELDRMAGVVAVPLPANKPAILPVPTQQSVQGLAESRQQAVGPHVAEPAEPPSKAQSDVLLKLGLAPAETAKEAGERIEEYYRKKKRVAALEKGKA